MDQLHMIHLLEQTVAAVTDGAKVMNARAEDLAFRSQHIANALKNGFPIRDKLFGDDLQLYRKALMQFRTAVMELPNTVSQLERAAHSDLNCIRAIQSLQRAFCGLQKEMRNVQATTNIAHQHIRNTTFKVESTYAFLEIEKMTQKTDLLPQAIAKILLVVAAAPL